MGVPSCFHHQHAETNSTSAYFVIMTELTLSPSRFCPTGHRRGFTRAAPTRTCASIHLIRFFWGVRVATSCSVNLKKKKERLVPKNVNPEGFYSGDVIQSSYETFTGFFSSGMKH